MKIFRGLRAWLLRYYSVFLLLLVYELLSRLELVPAILVPSLELIFKECWKYLANGELIYHASISLYRALLGFSLAVIVGAVLGAAMARNKWLEAVFQPIFSFAYPLPKIALYPLFIFAFGLGTTSKVILVFMECLFPIVLHAHAGIKSADRALIWAARGMGANDRQLFFKVLLPAALPTLFAGLRIALPVCLVVTIMTEILGESRGLGYFITFNTSSFEYARAFAALLVVAVIGFCMDRGLVLLRSKIMFWDKFDPGVGRH